MSITLEIIEGPDVQRDKDGWENRAYKVRLKRNGRSLTTEYHKGMGLLDPPSAEEVLSSLLMDASGIEYDGFEAWAESYGFDPDSRKAERMYRGIEAQTRKLRRFLGDDFDACATEDAEDAAKRLVNA